MATKTAQTTRIVLAEDCEIFKDGFVLFLEKEANNEIHLISTPSTEKELLLTVKNHRPDVIIISSKLKLINSKDACTHIKNKFPKTALLLLATPDEEKLVLDMMNKGINGFISRNASKKSLIDAIKTVRNGSNYYCESMSGKLLDLISNNKPNNHKLKKIEFNDNELQIIQLICKQYSSKEIADTLDLSIRTVDDYRHKIQEKIDAKNVVGIVIYAIENRLIEVFVNS